LGEPSIRYDRPCRAERLQVLTTALRRYYPARHPVVLYEAAQFPGCRPLIKRIPLARMPEVPVYTMTTLYLRPKRSRLSDRKIMNWFDEA
jgi:hypothetical protein